MGEFVAELKRRNVLRAGLAYLALGWLLLQVAGLVIPAFGWPGWVLRALVILVALGFPVTVVLAWVFDFGPSGLKRDEDTGSAEVGRPRGRTTDRVIVAALVAVVLVLVFDKVVLQGRREDESAAAPGKATTAAASIAVLPFVDMSQAHDQEYFSDGLSEELLAALARLPQLHVAGRTSSFSFKGKDTDLKSIGEKLGVATILEGSVRKSGERLRVTAQLINAADGFHLWSETYDRELTDVFAVQDEIAAAVVTALKVKLLPPRAGASAGRTVDPDAYLHYLRGRELINSSTADDFLNATAEFRKALELDPDYAAAHAGLAAVTGMQQVRPDSIAETALNRRNALVEAERAVALGPELAEAYSTRGHLRRTINWDWAGAEADLRKAIELDPSDPNGQLWHALLLSSLGRVPESLDVLRRRLEVDPLSASTWRYYGLYLAVSGRLAEARTALERSLELVPRNRGTQYWLGVTGLLAGRLEEARGAFELSPDAERLSGLAMVDSAAGNDDDARKALQELIDTYGRTAPTLVAQVYARRGERDEAFAWMQRAFDAHDDRLMYLKISPLLENVRDDPRYAELVKKMNLPP